MPLYMLGFMGATRRLDHYELSTGWHPLFIVVAIGAFIILCGVLVQIYGLIIAILHRKKNRDTTGDPWNGRTLEWSTPSPPPFYNFAVIPAVDQIDPFWASKHQKTTFPPQKIEGIYLPKNTSTGLFVGLFSLFFGFGLTWHIYWLALASLLAIIASLIHRLWGADEHELIPADKIKAMEAQYALKRESHS